LLYTDCVVRVEHRFVADVRGELDWFQYYCYCAVTFAYVCGDQMPRNVILSQSLTINAWLLDIFVSCLCVPSYYFTGWMPFLLPNQQCQSTEGNYRLRIREKTLEFSTVLPVPFPYLTGGMVEVGTG